MAEEISGVDNSVKTEDKETSIFSSDWLKLGVGLIGISGFLKLRKESLRENADILFLYGAIHLTYLMFRGSENPSFISPFLNTIMANAIPSIMSRRLTAQQERHDKELKKVEAAEKTVQLTMKRAEEAVKIQNLPLALDQYRKARKTFSTLFKEKVGAENPFYQLSFEKLSLEEAQIRLATLNNQKAIKRFLDILKSNPKDSQAQWGLVIALLQEVEITDDSIFLSEGKYFERARERERERERERGDMSSVLDEKVSNSLFIDKKNDNQKQVISYLSQLFSQNKSDNAAFLLVNYLQGNYDAVINLMHMNPGIFHQAISILGTAPTLEPQKNILLLKCYGKALLKREHYPEAAWVFQYLWHHASRDAGQQDRYASLLLLTIAAYQGLLSMGANLPLSHIPFVGKKMTLATMEYIQALSTQEKEEHEEEKETKSDKGKAEDSDMTVEDDDKGKGKAEDDDANPKDDTDRVQDEKEHRAEASVQKTLFMRPLKKEAIEEQLELLKREWEMCQAMSTALVSIMPQSEKEPGLRGLRK